MIFLYSTVYVCMVLDREYNIGKVLALKSFQSAVEYMEANSRRGGGNWSKGDRCRQLKLESKSELQTLGGEAAMSICSLE